MSDAREHVDNALLELRIAAGAQHPEQQISRLMAAYGEAMVAFNLAEDADETNVAEEAAEIIAAAETAGRTLCAGDVAPLGPDRRSALPNPDLASRRVLREIERI